MSAEEWRPIPGFDGYFVSSRGRIQSTRPWRGDSGPRQLKASVGNRGYRIVSLSTPGARQSHTVHSLVALAFIGPRPDGQEVRHLDGCRTNNCVENLAYGTHVENMLDAVAHGTHVAVRRTHCVNGHEFVGHNIKRDRRGNRTCRACHIHHNTAYRNRFVPEGQPTASDVRAWARRNEMPVGSSGPVSPRLVQAYLAAHSEAAA